MLHDVLKPLIVILIVTGVTLLVSQVIPGQIPRMRLISNEGRIKTEGVGVYFNLNCTAQIFYLDWGELQPASTKNQTIFVRNEGNSPATLFLTTTDWNPTNISQYVHLTWDYKSQTIYPYETIQLTLTLVASSSPEFQNYIITNDARKFSFNITINAHN